MKEVAHDCVMALKNWFVGKGIKNSFDTWHGTYTSGEHTLLYLTITQLLVQGVVFDAVFCKNFKY